MRASKTEQERYVLQRTGMTYRQYREAKRKQLRAVYVAILKLHQNCAAIPSASREVYLMMRSAERMKKHMSIKQWGR